MAASAWELNKAGRCERDGWMDGNLDRSEVSALACLLEGRLFWDLGWWLFKAKEIGVGLKNA